MKLQTSITPRRDKTVKVTGLDGKPYVFAAGEDGELSCDVPDEATVTNLLASGNFWPADEQDLAAAEALLAAALAAEAAEAGGGDGDGEDEDDEEGDGAEVVNGGLPLEANTPPAPKKPGRPRKAQA